MEFKEIVSPSLKDLFVKEIERMIFSGELKIGDRLPPEREMAKMMSVSQTVVNTGIVVLATRGLLKVVPRKGTFVADYKSQGGLETLNAMIDYNESYFLPTMMKSLFEFRNSNETTFTKMAVKNRTSEDLEAMKKCLINISLADTVEDTSKAVFKLYKAISIASKNTVYPLITNGFKQLYISILEICFNISGSNAYEALLKQLVQQIEIQNVEEACKYIAEAEGWEYDILKQRYNSGESYFQ